MTKSFLVFPTGSAGGALLLLRLVLAAALGGSIAVVDTNWWMLIAALLILALLAGIFTRVVALLCAGAALVVFVRVGGSLGFSAILHGFCAVRAVDAWSRGLFGRRPAVRPACHRTGPVGDHVPIARTSNAPPTRPGMFASPVQDVVYG